MRFKRKRYRRPVEWIDTNFTTNDYDGTSAYGAGPLLNIMYGGATQNSPYLPIYNETPILIGDDPQASVSMLEETKQFTIRRIVGSVHISWDADKAAGGGNIQVQPAMVKWGFAVKNVVPDENGFASVPEALWQTFNAQVSYFSEMDWMSMRTEIYGANYDATVNAITGAPTNLAWNNWTIGKIMQPVAGLSAPSDNFANPDSNRVDVRVNRTVRRNQRLFLCFGISGMVSDDSNYSWHNNPHRLFVWTDLRVLVNWKRGGAANRKG